MKKSKYFKLYELLPPELYKNEDTGWEYLDERLIDTIDCIWEMLNVPLIANTWKQGGTYKERGFRLASSKTGAPKSQHKLGRATDLVSATMKAEQMREIIKKKAAILPHNIRIEAGVSWLHVDVKDMGVKVYEFKV